jgi:glyoxylase-like metal-dependent hydrolase (beta-lactamase superfamily II)
VHRRAAIADLGHGVFRVTQPLPWALDHVHCYAVADDDGWTLVDAGLGTPGTAGRWQAALAELGSPRVGRIVLTHYHPDHVGASADLVELTGADEVVQGELDAALAARAWGDDQDLREFGRYMASQGMPSELAEASAADESRLAVQLAEPTRLVREGDMVELGGEEFRILHLPGHADGHIALFGERSGRLFGGDVLLHDITPNVGRWSDSQPDPLGAYLKTLRRLGELSPRVVYPGHRRVIDDASGRAVEIQEHHRERLDLHRQALVDGAAMPYDVALRVWGDDLGFHERRFALVEAVAHLERLAWTGRAEEVAPGRWQPL